MSESKGGQRRIDKQSPKSLLREWRQGLSAAVKSYYIDRKKKPWEKELHEETEL